VSPAKTSPDGGVAQAAERGQGAPRRVLILTPWFPNRPGDRQGNFIHDSAAALAAQGLEISVLVTRPWAPGPLQRLRPAWSRDAFEPQAFEGFRRLDLVRHLSLPRGLAWRTSEALHDRAVANHLASLAEAVGAELIHAHTEGEAAVAVRVGRDLGLPVVVTLHGLNLGPRHLGSRARRRRFGAAIAAADRVILVGEPLRPVFCEAADGDGNFRVVFNGAAMPHPAPAPRAFEAGDPIRFVAVANLNEGKGHDVALRALANAEAAGAAEWTFTIAGDGPERSMLERLSAELGLAHKVRFLGVVPHDRVFEVLRQADVFLLPSYREAFGVAYVEAMTSGLLAIGVRGEGPEAFVRHGETGLLAARRDADDLGRLILRMAADRPGAAAMAAAGQAEVRARFTWAAHARALRAIYAEAAEMHR
jgi:glycosyltransferase involved in cell wall biosynthesis